jgi:type II secretion system protein D
MRTAFFSLILLFTLSPAGLLPLSAQNPETPPPGPGAAGTSGDFGNLSNINAILDVYEQLSGKHLVRDVNLAGIQMSITATGVSKAEMLKLIEANLLLNGVAFVPIDEHTLKVMTVATNKNPGSEGVRLYANVADLPINDQIVSYYMPLNYLSPQEVVGIFSQAVHPHNYGTYVPLPTAQAVVITENSSVIRQLIALKELMDVPPARVVSEFIQLNRADADTMAALLTKMLNPTSAPGAAPAVSGGAAVVPPDLGNSAPLSNERNLLSGPAQIISDPRSNRLLVVTRPVNMPFLKELINQLDKADNFITPKSRPLKYVLAQDILVALESALAQGKDEEDQVAKNQTANPNKQSTTPGGAPAGNNSLGNSSGGSGSVSSVTASLQAPQENNVPTVVTIGKTKLMADNNSNSIIIFGSQDIVDRVTAMIDQLDRKPLQVYLATVIGELTVSQGTEFGIDILQKFQKVGQGGLATSVVTPGTAGFAGSTSSSTTSTTSPVLDPRNLISSTGFPLPTGLTLYGAIGSTLDAYVRALETTNRFKVISRPSVYTTNNKLAVIASGSQIPVPGNITSGFTGSSSNTLTTTANVNYESVLLELQIVPLINANHEVTLKIRQTNNSQGASQVISGNSVPTILTQEINTEVTVPDKSTVVIGGLITDNTKYNTSGVPLLSDIPILGYLFRDTSKSKERDELIIMIQPTVVETDAEQIAANEMEKRRTILGREAEDAASYTMPETSAKVPVHPSTSGDIGVAVPTHETQPVVTVKPLPATPQVKVKTTTISSSSETGPIPSGSSSKPPKNNSNSTSFPSTTP